MTSDTADSLFLRSYGGRGLADRTRWQTVFLANTLLELTRNNVTGTVLDVRGLPPPNEATILNALKVFLYYPMEGKLHADELTNTELLNGQFMYTNIPQGTHRLRAMFVNITTSDTTNTNVDVTVYPGVGARDLRVRLQSGLVEGKSPVDGSMKNRAFTLMELLVVLLIIGILSTVALRTIDATRDRSLFDQTTKEMAQLVQAMIGNPDLTYDGRRVDFGFYGDMGRLPQDLKELVHNETSSPYWHGPYIRPTMGGDTASFRYDGWGNEYAYNQGTGTISTVGNGKYTMTVRVVDSLLQLYYSIVTGTVSDVDNNPPGTKPDLFTSTSICRRSTPRAGRRP